MTQSLSIVISGEAGQGIQTIESFLVRAISKEYHVSSHSDVMSRVRGGNNTTEIRISHYPIAAFQHRIDLLFLLNNQAIDRLKERINKDTIIFGEEDSFADPWIENRSFNTITVPLKELAKEAGGTLFANTILVGLIAALLQLDETGIENMITETFSHKGKEIIEKNLKALTLGKKQGLASDIYLPRFEKLKPRDKSIPLKVMNGSEAIGIGALAGGCNYIASYPMSPSTGVLVYLANKATDFGVLVEQAEDEIAALNMTLGASYAGARAMVTTSGGGIALMSETISLAGMTETPCVIYDAQRPGPATGLPTRTEQGDLNLVRYCGHGTFPRIILAPASLEDGIKLSQKAFDLADRFQVPVFILADQFYTDSLGQMAPFEIEDTLADHHIVKTQKNYLRYAFNPNGISPRGIPGLGNGFVKVDSDEHDEEGLITEDFDTRVAMQDKRMAKVSSILQDYQPEHTSGNLDAKYLIIGWGSTWGPISCFVKEHPNLVGHIHLQQLYPLPLRLKDRLANKTVLCIENNYEGQLADLLKLELDIDVDHRILKYSGEPFSTEEIEEKMQEVIL